MKPEFSGARRSMSVIAEPACKPDNPRTYFAFSTFSPIDFVNHKILIDFGIVGFKVVMDPQNLRHVLIKMGSPKRKRQIRRYLKKLDVTLHKLSTEDEDITTFGRNEVEKSFYNDLVAKNLNDYPVSAFTVGRQANSKVKFFRDYDGWETDGYETEELPEANSRRSLSPEW